MISPPDQDDSYRSQPVRGVRWIYTALGLVLTGIGIVGAFVPLLPTTIFLILAASCFARSSPRLERWLLDHPRFGPGLRAWRNEGAVSRRAKIMACIGMSVGYGLFALGSRPGPLLAAAVAVFMLGSAAYVVSRPEPRPKPDV
ncbi:YbaN family protein [Mangrovicella endophytica]|uniref:YbaN family protein n=1 Tax=Mangrovicella endophytica TaxID=2066697 RepID=UPI000C9E97D0|nr:YbaN family protein [Mangrovicella endophytica]